MDSGRLKLALALALATSQFKTCPACLPACLQPWLSEGHVAIKQTSLKQGMPPPPAVSCPPGRHPPTGSTVIRPSAPPRPLSCPPCRHCTIPLHPATSTAPPTAPPLFCAPATSRTLALTPAAGADGGAVAGRVPRLGTYIAPAAGQLEGLESARLGVTNGPAPLSTQCTVS